MVSSFAQNLSSGLVIFSVIASRKRPMFSSRATDVLNSLHLVMAQRVVHQVTQMLAPACVPLLLTDGFKAYRTAILAHFGSWMHPERRQERGPMPRPRWIPLPALRYAPV